MVSGGLRSLKGCTWSIRQSVSMSKSKTKSHLEHKVRRISTRVRTVTGQ